MIISDSLVWSLTNKDINESFKSSEMSYKYEEFNGEASENEIARLSQIAKDNNINVIVGVGGGKTLDTAKAISDDLNSPVIIVPTTASTDAPTSALSVIYSDEGVLLVTDFTIKPKCSISRFTNYSPSTSQIVCGGHERCFSYFSRS